MKLLCCLVTGLLTLTSTIARADKSTDDVLAEVLNLHPYTFDACEVDNSLTTQCTEPDGLEQLEITSDINIEVILDVSGSMAGSINNKTKYQIATQALQEFVNVLPGHVNLALRVYGHQGSNKESDKAFSCNSSSLVYPFQALDQKSFMNSVHSFQPTGWTALGLSLQHALEDFNKFDSEANNNIIYLLTDGIETCGGDPVAAARAIANSSVKAAVNVIAFDIGNEDAQAIKSIAEAGNGEYFTANNLQELVSVFTTDASWREWRQYLECRWKTANQLITEIQNKELERFNCVLDEADKITLAIENTLIEQYPDVEAQVMLEVFNARLEAEQPHLDRYNNDEKFQKYQRELLAIETIREKLDN